MNLLELIGLGAVVCVGLKALVGLINMVEDVKRDDRKRGVR